MRALGIDHLVLTVADPDRSADWYVTVLGARRHDRDGRISVHLDRQKINLRPVDATQEAWFTSVAPRPGSADLCFIVDSPPDAVVAHLDRRGVAIELGPVVKQGAQGDIRSVYCRDLDGNLIELSTYC